MSAARLACNADLVGPDLEVARMRLDPADCIIDVDQRGRVSISRVAEIQRGDNEAVLRQCLIEALGARQIATGPRAAVEVDDRRERAVALGLIDTRDQGLVAVAQILDIFRCDFISRHRHSLSGLRSWSSSRAFGRRPRPDPVADLPPYSLSAIGERPGAKSTRQRI